ncbi:hypothetical protein V5O48_003696 [Marasmius crinis-equi]|uniref:Uncharacterized protein n=1 Tax=Marasmius crinis-equi TaxID=585013 RepID=A0ABR3FS47_9AGAR
MTSNFADRNYHHAFEQIHNFRDAGRTINDFLQSHTTTTPQPKLKEGLLFRSGRLDEATTSDLERLGDEYGVKTVIDLRTKSEHIQAKKKKERLERKPQRGEEMPLLREETRGEVPWKTVQVNFIGRKYELQMLKELGFFRGIIFLFLMLFQFRMTAIRMVGRHVLSTKGILGLNLDLLKFCQKEILEANSNSDADDLLLQAIKHDYALSAQGIPRDSMLHEVRGIGMTEDYLTAPMIVVDEVYRYLVADYGGPEGYLDVIGFGEEQREKLRRILLV